MKLETFQKRAQKHIDALNKLVGEALTIKSHNGEHAQYWYISNRIHDVQKGINGTTEGDMK